ncbi:MAG: DUF535 family protein [Herbaspirillum sp.]|nr:DUF535 family protein [Herbaspirillum sp.]
MNQFISDDEVGKTMTGEDDKEHFLSTSPLRLFKTCTRWATRAACIILFNQDVRALNTAMCNAGITSVIHYTWKTRYRCLRSSYLRGAFSTRQNLKIATLHYLTLVKHARPDFLKIASNEGFLLWQHRADNGHSYRIHLRYPYFYNFDGDLAFCMDCDGADIYVVSATIAPGELLGLPMQNAMLVAGIQGINGRLDDIRTATEACNNVSPPHMLLAAVEAFSLQLDIRDMVGIASLPGRQAQNQGYSYDSFWQPLSGQDRAGFFHHIPLPFSDKPLESIQAKHRSRARKRRELRNAIRQEIIASARQVIADRLLRL